MTDLFLKIFNMSISASYVILAVVLLRLLLKKAPKWISVVLWGLVAVRLVLPASLPNPFSLIPGTETVPPQIMTDPTPSIQSGISAVNNTLNPFIEQVFTPAPGASVNPLQIWIPILTRIWVAGVAGMLLYTLFSYFRIKEKVRTAVLLRENLYQSENAVSPFVLGLVKPKIYLPFDVREGDLPHVIAHEQAHIKRKDHLWKPLGFLLLTLHWFNPLLWLSYVLLCRDIELACDEKVVKTLGRDLRAEYSQALLNCSVNRRMIAACPLAFGETGVKSRVKSVLHYKKPAFWMLILGILLCAAVTVFFLTDPLSDENRGAKSLSLQWKDVQTVEFELRYTFPQGTSFSVRYVPEDEGQYIGDGMIPYDGSLGKHRILVEFGDMEPSEAFREQFPAGKAVELASAPARIFAKVGHPQDHGFVLYLGFDVPVAVTSVQGKLNTFGGTLTIPVTLLEDSEVALREKFPAYFGLDYSKGLDVYVWQMAAGIYSFGLLPHGDHAESPFSEKLLGMKGASYEEMRQILTSYPLTAQRIHVIPWVNPVSSYRPLWESITEAEIREKEKQLYTEGIRRRLFDTYDYPITGDELESTYFDFDGDGNGELCSLHGGDATTMDRLAVNVKAGDESYCRILWTDNAESCTFSFYSEISGELLLKVTDREDPDSSRLLSITVKGGRLFIKENGTHVGVTPATSAYAMDRPFARKVFDVDGDGIPEVCSMYPGPTSGVFTFGLSAREIGKTEYDFNDVYHTDPCALSFRQGKNGVWYVKEVKHSPEEETRLYEISVSEGHAVLKSSDGKTLYWLQGLQDATK